jgi:hypothetical protein
MWGPRDICRTATSSSCSTARISAIVALYSATATCSPAPLRPYRNGAHPHRVMVPSREQPLPCGRAHRGRVEAGIAQSAGGEPFEGRRPARTTEGAVRPQAGSSSRMSRMLRGRAVSGGYELPAGLLDVSESANTQSLQFGRSIALTTEVWCGPSPGGRKDIRLHHSLDVRSDTICPIAPHKFWYPCGTMSALNGDKARFNRERRAKLARRERSQAIRRKLKDRTPRPTGTQL